jgi:hypothetical protein
VSRTPLGTALLAIVAVFLALLLWVYVGHRDRGSVGAGETHSRVALASKAQTLDALTSALRTAVVDGHDFLIVTSDKPKNYYVQIVAPEEKPSKLPATISAEAVSNRYLERSARLSDEQERTLTRLGWSAPSAGSPNWSRVFRLGEDARFSAIAEALYETLAQVYAYAGGALDITTG